jgi:hypothetical protein
LTSGCVTRALWTEADLDTWNEPAEHPRLGLFDHRKPKDVLVVYDEYRERGDVVQPRAYLLHANASRLGELRRPRFIKHDRREHLAAVPLLAAPSVTDTNPAPLLYAVLGGDGKTFKIYSEGQESGLYELPTYNDGAGRIKRIVLTPFAATADLTVVGGALFMWFWSRGGMNGVH